MLSFASFFFIWHVESSVRFSPNNQIVIVHEKDFIIRIFDDVVDCIKLHYFRPETLIFLTARCLLPRPITCKQNTDLSRRQTLANATFQFFFYFAHVSTFCKCVCYRHPFLNGFMFLDFAKENIQILIFFLAGWFRFNPTAKLHILCILHAWFILCLSCLNMCLNCLGIRSHP